MQCENAKKSAVVNVSENKIERARVANNALVTAEEYKQYRNARNAIEGIPSVLRRVYNVDEMPVFGIMKSKMMFGLKIAAINVKKLAKFVGNQSANFVLKNFKQDICAQI